MARNLKTKITPKLERFLMTIARRRSIESIAVALFVVFDGMIVLGENNALPAKVLGPHGIGAAIGSLLDKLGLDGEVRYLGFFDNGKARQYNFAIGLDSQPDLGAGFIFVDAGKAAELLGRKEAKLIMGSFSQPPMLRQMLIW
ncbi:hypothetical protein L0Y65_02530 [Candidatus Micrarchaeota archaeon]|nr:hypothetical protein [Candidatus Micrarchaeota archaeon]